jgi:hypothetical protein
LWVSYSINREEIMKKYWMVNRLGTSSSHVHDTLESAIEEATRLARGDKMNPYYVLEVVKIVKQPDAPIEVIDPEPVETANE